MSHQPDSKTKLVRYIPEGDRNRDVEIEARQEGLVIDDIIVIPWDWIEQSRQALSALNA